MSRLLKAYTDQNGEMLLLEEGTTNELLAAVDTTLIRVAGADSIVSDDYRENENVTNVDADDITDDTTTHKFATQTQLNQITLNQNNITQEVIDRLAGDQGSIAIHNDIDLTGVSEGSVLERQGAVFIPKRKLFEAFANRTDGLVNQQNNNFEPYLTLSVNIPETGNYKLELSFRYSINNTTVNFQSHVVPDGSTNLNDFLFISHIESKDSGGVGLSLPSISNGVVGGNVNTGTDQFLTYTGFVVLKNLSAGNHSYLLEWAAQGDNLEAAIYNAHFYMKEVRI